MAAVERKLSERLLNFHENLCVLFSKLIKRFNLHFIKVHRITSV